LFFGSNSFALTKAFNSAVKISSVTPEETEGIKNVGEHILSTILYLVGELLEGPFCNRKNVLKLSVVRSLN
jgi:hypothetical protein